MARYAVFVLGGCAMGLSVGVSLVGWVVITVIPSSIIGATPMAGFQLLPEGGMLEPGPACMTGLGGGLFCDC